MNQTQRILSAMMNGETVHRLWAAKEVPIIAQPGNRCNELKATGIPVQKLMIYPEEGAHYMAYWLTSDYIQEARLPNTKCKCFLSPIAGLVTI